VALYTSHSLVTKSDSRARGLFRAMCLSFCVYSRVSCGVFSGNGWCSSRPSTSGVTQTASLESKLFSLYRTVPVPCSSHHLEALESYIHHPKVKRMSCPRTMTAVALTPDPPSRHRQDAAHTRFAVQPPRELYPPPPGLLGYLDR
jgi:hypothetical protein